MGPRLRQALIDRFQTPASILKATTNELRQVPGIGSQIAEAIVRSANRLAAIAELQACENNGYQLLTPYDQQYPDQLEQIPDPPGTLYVHGEVRKSDKLAIAIVGTRHASRYGLAQARRLAGGLAKAGYTIVSGLARGIDTAAHYAALAAGGRTLAVLGSGLKQIYPPENRELASQIANSGAVLTEHSLEHRPKSSSFPQRNRIVTGLSLGVVVVEAALRSGALISARHAMEQNREVFAVPGRVDNRMSAGCHQLIRDGARLVEKVDDVIEELGPLANTTIDVHGHSVRHPAELLLNEQERKLLTAMDEEPVSIEDIVVQTSIPVSRVLATLSVLEARKLVTRVSGTHVCRRSCYQ